MPSNQNQGPEYSFNAGLHARDAEVQQLHEERDGYAAVIEEALGVLAHIVSQANVNPVDGDDGFIAWYDMPVGSIHKAIPFLARHGIVADEFGSVRKSASVDSRSVLAERDRTALVEAERGQGQQ